MMDPGWSTISPMRLLYRAHNVSALLRPGDNGLGVRLGFCHYGYIDQAFCIGSHAMRDTCRGFVMYLSVKYADGTTQGVVTTAGGGAWRGTTTANPIVCVTPSHGSPSTLYCTRHAISLYSMWTAALAWTGTRICITERSLTPERSRKGGTAPVSRAPPQLEAGARSVYTAITQRTRARIERSVHLSAWRVKSSPCVVYSHLVFMVPLETEHTLRIANNTGSGYELARDVINGRGTARTTRQSHQNTGGGCPRPFHPTGWPDGPCHATGVLRGWALWACSWRE